MDNQKHAQSNPKVTIVCATYNHEPYIRKALDGFLMQKTNFEFEILIHDDASTDNTANIIREYAARYPKIFNVILQTENQYSKGTRIFMNLLPMVKSDYVAICEGDDYWTDENKLQIQVDILEQHFECSACGHNVLVVDRSGVSEGETGQQRSIRHTNDVILNIDSYQPGGRFAHTAALLIRREIFFTKGEECWKAYQKIHANGDIIFALLMILNGSFYFSAKQMACYRHVTDSGDSWSARTNGCNLTQERYFSQGELTSFAKRWYDVELDDRQYLLYQLKLALIYYLKKPTKENRDILMSIVKHDKQNGFRIIKHLPFRTYEKLKEVLRGEHA